VGERIPGGYVYVDGSGVGDIGPSVMREREALAQDGFVIVNLRVNKAGQLVGKPDIISRGFVFVRDSEEMFESAQAQIASVAARANGSLREKVQQTLAEFFYAELKRRPMIFALVNEV
jgi:ribonuclease J